MRIITVLCLVLFAACSSSDVNDPNKLYPVKKGEKYGYMTYNGEEKIPARFEKATSFSDGMALVKNDNQYTFIKQDGTFLSENWYKSATSFSEGKAFVAKKGQNLACININGEILFELPQVTGISNFNNGIAVGQRGNETIWIDSTGNTVGKTKKQVYNWGVSDDMMPFQEIKMVRSVFGYPQQKKTFGYVNYKDENVIPAEYDRIDVIREGTIHVEKDGMQGLLDVSGKVIIPLTRMSVGTSSDSLISIKKDGKYGFINLNGDTVIGHKYENINRFKGGTNIVVENGHQKIINNKGETLFVPDTGIRITSADGDVLVYSKNGKKGLMSTNGKIFTPASYEAITLYSDEPYCKADFADFDKEWSAINFDTTTFYIMGINQGLTYNDVKKLFPDLVPNAYNPEASARLNKAINADLGLHSVLFFFESENNNTNGNSSFYGGSSFGSFAGGNASWAKKNPIIKSFQITFKLSQSRATFGKDISEAISNKLREISQLKNNNNLRYSDPAVFKTGNKQLTLNVSGDQFLNMDGSAGSGNLIIKGKFD
jgi:hypothetical protein